MHASGIANNANVQTITILGSDIKEYPKNLEEIQYKWILANTLKYYEPLQDRGRHRFIVYSL